MILIHDGEQRWLSHLDHPFRGNESSETAEEQNLASLLRAVGVARGAWRESPSWCSCGRSKAWDLLYCEGLYLETRDKLVVEGTWGTGGGSVVGYLVFQ